MAFGEQIYQPRRCHSHRLWILVPFLLKTMIPAVMLLNPATF